MKVVLLHAFPLDERMWEPQLEALRDHEVVTPRLYGRSGSIDEIAASLLAEEGEGELVPVGASMGGYVALALAAREPSRIRALVLVGARADADTAERRAGRAQTLALIESGGAQALWENQRPRLLLDSAAGDAVELARRCALRRTTDELLEAVAAIRDRPDRSPALASFERPVLVAVGEHDGFLPPEEAQRQAQTARHGRFRVFGGAGHLPSLEQADEFNAALTGFLADV